MTPKKWCMRILVSSVDSGVETRIRSSLEKVLNDYICHLSAMQPYWKFEGWGELIAEIKGAGDINQIKNRFAIKWEGDVADKSWTTFFDDAIMFLWIAESE